MNDITLIAASFNTPTVTKKMIQSFKMFYPEVPILISENSSNEDTINILKELKTSYITHGSNKHSPSVDVLFNLVKTRYALLVDTDVIFLRPIDKIFNEFKALDFAVLGDVCTDDGKMYKPRLHPCFIIIDLHAIKKHDIKFHDNDRTDNKAPMRNTINYDVGSSFLEDIRAKNLRVADFKGYKFYYNHYGAMSWGVLKYNPNLNCQHNFDTGEHKHLHVYENEIKKIEQYKEDTRYLDAEYKHQIKICVNTHHNFSAQTLPIIIPSLLAAGVNIDEILIVEGGHETRTDNVYHGIQIIKTSHNSIEYTGLIDIVEHSIESEYWFMIHDTCRVGPNFKKLLHNIPDNADKVALKDWPSMSIGTYSYKYLKSQTDRLMSIKNTDYSREKIQYWKQWGIKNEDYMLWHEKTTPCSIYNPTLIHPLKLEIISESPWYVDTNTVRRVEYYSQLDLYKNKANWGAKPWMEIDV